MPSATSQATQQFAANQQEAESLYREFDGITVSSVGIGTYLGAPDDETDARYADAIVRAVELGVNFIDTASNYRYQRSERAIDQALRTLAGKGIAREALFLCSKAGFLAFDGAVPADPKAWFEETFVKPGIADYVDVVHGVHCMAPAYLKYEIGQSLRNLGVDSIDVYYVHNPETQLALLTRPAFYKRLREAFVAMEEEVAAGRIQRYGLATWDGFRVPPEDGRFLDLNQVVQVAKEAAGSEKHHFSMVQLPYNLAMTEAYTLPNQDDRPFLEAAAEQGIAVVTSASLMQSQVIGRIPEAMRALAQVETDAQAALQFARSAPGVLTSLAGMSSVAHVEENLGILGVAPVGPTSYDKFFG